MAWSNFAFQKKVALAIPDGWTADGYGAIAYDGYKLYVLAQSGTQVGALAYDKNGRRQADADTKWGKKPDGQSAGFFRTGLGGYWHFRSSAQISRLGWFDEYSPQGVAGLSVEVDTPGNTLGFGRMIVSATSTILQTIFFTYAQGATGDIVPFNYLGQAGEFINSNFPPAVSGTAATDTEAFVCERNSTVITPYSTAWAPGGTGGRLQADNDDPMGMAYAFGQFAVGQYPSSGNDIDVYFYGAFNGPPEPPGPPPSVKQFRGLKRYIRQFDVVTLGSNRAVQTVKALNVDMLESTEVELLDGAPGTGVASRLRNITFTPRWTVPTVEVGDTIILSQGSGDAGGAIIMVPAGVALFTVRGTDIVGNKKQVIYAERVVT